MSCLNCLKILEGDVVDYETFCGRVCWDAYNAKKRLDRLEEEVRNIIVAAKNRDNNP